MSGWMTNAVKITFRYGENHARMGDSPLGSFVATIQFNKGNFAGRALGQKKKKKGFCNVGECHKIWLFNFHIRNASFALSL